MRLKSLFILLLLFSTNLQPVDYVWGETRDGGAPTDPDLNKWDGLDKGWLIEQSSSEFDSEDILVSRDGVTTQTQTGIFKPAVGDTLQLTNTVRIKGDVEIRFDGSDNSDPEVFPITIGDSSVVNGDGTWVDETPVNVAAFSQEAVTTINDYSQLIFNVAQMKTIEVNLLTNLNFHSVDAQTGYVPGEDGRPDSDSVGVPRPLYVTIRGKGSVVFRLPSGRRVYFGPPNPGQVAEGDDPADDPLSYYGVRVQVLMEQSSLDVFGQKKSNGEYETKPRNQLTFAPWSYYTETTDDDVQGSVLDGEAVVNTATTKPTWITFGQKSSFVFVSDNFQGVAERWIDQNGDNDIDLGEPVPRPGYGSVAFDPSNKGYGRMILEIARGQKPSGNDFTDAGFNLYGAFLVPTLAATDRAPAAILNEDFRENVFFNQRAGIRAIMRITDDVEYFDRVTRTDNGDSLTLSDWLERPETDHRGLVVINHNNSIPHFANGYDGEQSIDASVWAGHNDYEPGFIIGVNGEIDVTTHRFLDYVANNENKTITASHAPHTSDKVKKHNPAALYADGLPSYTHRTRFVPDQFGIPISDILFMGHKPEFGSHARIRLEGNAKCFVRAAAPYHTESTSAPLWRDFEQAEHNGHYHLNVVDGDVMTFAMGMGKYDGKEVAVLNSSGEYIMQSTEAEGANALDVEGMLSITSYDAERAEQVSVGELLEDKKYTLSAAGVFNIPSIELDYTGREVGYNNFEEYATWLDWLAWWSAFSVEEQNAHIDAGTDQTTYQLSDGSLLTINSESDHSLVQSIATRPLVVGRWYAAYNISSIQCNANLIFNKVNWRHNDVARNQEVPKVLPHPYGQARPHVVGGELASLKGQLYQPLIALYDTTINCHESFVATGVALTVNEQVINPAHGDSLDMANNSSKIVCYNRGREIDDNSFGRVFQLGSYGNTFADGTTAPELLTAGHLDVYRAGPTSGATADLPTTIQLQLQTAQEDGVSASERALHTVYLANESQVHLGWPTIEADTGYAPSSIDNTILDLLKADDPKNKKEFRFSPYETGVAELQVAGGPFLFGAGDSLDVAPPDTPIAGIDVGGVLYVDHGGKMSVSGSHDVYFNTVLARRTAVDAAAMGATVLPSDQAHYLAGGTQQLYDIDFVNHKHTQGALAGHVMVDTTNTTHLFDVQQSYPDDDGFEQAK